ncbi:MAG: beta-D-glucuronidase [bacterium ADurb.Bin236]|nr:MAG: beta-D-glucuronidase [bacterium ADurb.Bin236]
MAATMIAVKHKITWRRKMIHVKSNKHIKNKISAPCFSVSFLTFLMVCVSSILGSSSAGADVIDYASSHRTVISLNGQWKFKAGDNADYSDPRMDDSEWKSIKVPGFWNRQGYSESNVGWYRKKFFLPKNSKPSLLRIERILDEAEVWVNGEKLVNPGFQSPLEDRQPGTYADIWTLEWPEAFSVGQWARAGAENVIAVRVSNNPIRRSEKIASHDDRTFSGDAGISGKVSIICHPSVYIQAFERLRSPKKNGSVAAEHVFRAMIGVSDMETEKFAVSLVISDPQGVILSEKSQKQTIGPSGKAVEFKWAAEASFDTLTAEISVSGENGRSDSMSMKFHAASVSSSGGKLFVNGEPFTVKGVEGMPGLVSAGGLVKASTYKSAWAKSDLESLANMGVNAVRVETPPVSLVAAARDAGIMIVPVIDRDVPETVVALREFPNILYWDISLSGAAKVAAAVAAAHSLDTYKRPISYSGPDDIDSSRVGFRKISIRGINADKLEVGECAPRYNEKSPGAAVVISGWGGGSALGTGYDEALAAPAFVRSYSECVKSNIAAGVFYANFSDRSLSAPAVRRHDSRQFNPFMSDILSAIFRDLSVSPSGSPNGKARSYIIENSGVSVANEIAVKAYSGGAVIARIDKLQPGRSFDFTLPETSKTSELRVDYKTHSGSTRRMKFRPSEPAYSPDAITADSERDSLSRGSANKVTVKVETGARGGEVSLRLSSDDPGASVSPPHRVVSASPGANAEFVFTVTPRSNRSRILLTATAVFTDNSRAPVKTYLPVAVK